MRVARNIIWNALGIGLPLVVGIIVVPAIIRGLGTEQFGFLSIIWMLIGYFGVFDLGLSRTLTQLAADRLSTGRESEIAALTSTTLIIIVIASVAVSMAVASAAPWIAQRALSATPALVEEGAAAIRWLCVSLPFVLLGTGLTGLLEAYQRFALINVVRLPTGVLLLAAPLAVLPFSRHVDVITAVLAGVRIVNAGVLVWLALRVAPGLRAAPLSFHRELVSPLLTSGGWMTVSNMVGPVMVYFDRFFIAALLGSTAVAFYTVPYDVLNRLLVLPTAIQGVLFPTFALLRNRNAARAASVFGRSSTITMLLMMPPLLGTLLLADIGLNLWLGPAFARQSALIARILVVGVIWNSMARTPFVFVQGSGYVKWTGVLHCLELPLYATALWSVLRGGAGVEGAAYAWTGRIIFDTLALYAMSVRIDPQLRRIATRDVSWLAAACIAAALLNWGLPAGIPVRLGLTLVLALLCGGVLLSYVGSVRLLLPKGGT